MATIVHVIRTKDGDALVGVMWAQDPGWEGRKDGVVGSKAEFARDLFDGAARGYDRLAAWLSYGQYRRWHMFLTSRLPVGRNALVLDVATGTCAVAIDLAERYGCRVVGVDLAARMLESGRRRVARAGLSDRIRLVRATAERLPFRSAAFDALTVTYLLRYVDSPADVVAEMGRVVRPGGWMASLEFDLPRGMWYALWKAHTRIVLPLAGRVVSPGWRAIGEFLGPSIETFARRHPPHQVASWWEAAGFRDIRWRRLSLGGAIVLWGQKRDG
ncbi:MAG: class I SAM-dependent methyltransferase [Armatimonadota bacterium]|nr:class I SAM-dependent methyltransferase [Armatimonadota bacterium]MDR5697844.1 class I SAM-dependent methyltransferase [Armatimonadota bacterium]